MRVPRISFFFTLYALVGFYALLGMVEGLRGFVGDWRHHQALVSTWCDLRSARVVQVDDDRVVIVADVLLHLPDGRVQGGRGALPGSRTTDRLWADHHVPSAGPIRCYYDPARDGRVDVSPEADFDRDVDLAGCSLVLLLFVAWSLGAMRRELREPPFDFIDVTKVPDVLYKVDGGKPFRVRMRGLGYRGLGFLLRRRDTSRAIVAAYACEDGASVAAVDGRGMVFSTLLEDGTLVETWGPRIVDSERFWFGARPKDYPRAGVNVRHVRERDSTLGEHVERHARHVREIQRRVDACPVRHDGIAVLAAIDRRKAWVELVRKQTAAWVGVLVCVVWLVGTPLVELRGVTWAELDEWYMGRALVDALQWSIVALCGWYLVGPHVVRALPWPRLVPGDVLVRRERRRKIPAGIAAREAADVLFHEEPPKPKKPQKQARIRPRFERTSREIWRLRGMFLSVLAAVALCIVASDDLAQQAWRLLATAPVKLQVEDARVEKVGSSRWGVDVHVHGPVDGIPVSGWEMLPGFETADVHQARVVADSLEGTSMLGYHRPEHVEASLQGHPSFALPGFALLFGLFGIVVLSRRWMREASRSDPGKRWFDWLCDSALEGLSASFKKVPKELGAKLIVDPKLLYDARNHLPKEPPTGWSVPVASSEGDGAWMIETDDATLIAQLVRDGVRVKLTVIIMPDDMKRPDDFESMEYLRHFRKVGDFVEQEAPDELQRDTPWVRFFVADRIEAGDPQDWPQVKVDRQLLN
jgi:hypothetical protein